MIADDKNFWQITFFDHKSFHKTLQRKLGLKRLSQIVHLPLDTIYIMIYYNNTLVEKLQHKLL